MSLLLRRSQAPTLHCLVRGFEIPVWGACFLYTLRPDCLINPDWLIVLIAAVLGGCMSSFKSPLFSVFRSTRPVSVRLALFSWFQGRCVESRCWLRRVTYYLPVLVMQPIVT